MFALQIFVFEVRGRVQRGAGSFTYAPTMHEDWKTVRPRKGDRFRSDWEWEGTRGGVGRREKNQLGNYYKVFLEFS